MRNFGLSWNNLQHNWHKNSALKRFHDPNTTKQLFRLANLTNVWNDFFMIFMLAREKSERGRVSWLTLSFGAHALFATTAECLQNVLIRKCSHVDSPSNVSTLLMVLVAREWMQNSQEHNLSDLWTLNKLCNAELPVSLREKRSHECLIPILISAGSKFSLKRKNWVMIEV